MSWLPQGTGIALAELPRLALERCHIDVAVRFCPMTRARASRCLRNLWCRSKWAFGGAIPKLGGIPARLLHRRVCACSGQRRRARLHTLAAHRSRCSGQSMNAPTTLPAVPTLHCCVLTLVCMANLSSTAAPDEDALGKATAYPAAPDLTQTHQERYNYARNPACACCATPWPRLLPLWHRIGRWTKA